MTQEIPLIPGGTPNRGGMFPIGAALLLAAAGLLGCLAIWSARTFADEPMLFVVRQLQWIGPGIGLFLLSSAVPFRFYRRMAGLLEMLSLAALAAVLFRGFAVMGSVTPGVYTGGLQRPQGSKPR